MLTEPFRQGVPFERYPPPQEDVAISALLPELLLYVSFSL